MAAFCSAVAGEVLIQAFATHALGRGRLMEYDRDLGWRVQDHLN